LLKIVSGTFVYLWKDIFFIFLIKIKYSCK